MPINSRGMNDDYVKYFELEEYVDRIDLSPSLLKHSSDTRKEFDKYMERLSVYEEEEIINYWILLLYQELRSNQKIENSKFDMITLANKSPFFDKLNIDHKRIHQLHNFVTEKEIKAGILKETFEYRSVPVNVSYYNNDGTEEIFWRGANPEDLKKFMNDFVKLYKRSGLDPLFSDPFLASSLMHLLFLRIHPYTDGNGRTARVIHNIKFTEMINKLHGTKLKLSPLNLSQSIYLNKITYVNRIDNIYFDIEHNTNKDINRWFDYILDMADEQIYRSNELLNRVKLSKMRKLSRENENIKNPSMGLSKIKR